MAALLKDTSHLYYDGCSLSAQALTALSRWKKVPDYHGFRGADPPNPRNQGSVGDCLGSQVQVNASSAPIFRRCQPLGREGVRASLTKHRRRSRTGLPEIRDNQRFSNPERPTTALAALSKLICSEACRREGGPAYTGRSENQEKPSQLSSSNGSRRDPLCRMPQRNRPKRPFPPR